MNVIDSRVVNIDALKLEHFAKGDKFESRSVRIGPPLGAKDLGTSDDYKKEKMPAVNVSMKIGANGTLKIENGGLRLPSNLVVGNE